MLEETLNKGNQLSRQIATSNAILEKYKEMKDKEGFHIRISVLTYDEPYDYHFVPVNDEECINKIIDVIREYHDKRKDEFDRL